MRSPISLLPLACLALLLAGAGMAPLMAQGLGDSTAAAPVTPDPKPDTQNFLPPKLATAGTGVTSPKLDSIAARTHAPNSAGCTPINPCATVTPALDGLGPVKAANGEPATNERSGGANRPARAAKGGAAKSQDTANAVPGGMRSGMGRPCVRGGNFAGGGGFGGGGFRPGGPPDPNDPEAAARRAKFIAAFRARMAANGGTPSANKPGAFPCGMNCGAGADGVPNGAGFRRGAQVADPAAGQAQ